MRLSSLRAPQRWGVLVEVKRAAIIVLLTALSIELHELAHFAAYELAGDPARLGLQRVDPLVPVPLGVHVVAKLAGPLMSLIAATALVIAARRRGGFVWATAAFTNATIRLLPLVLDVIAALRGAKPFSDEGVVALEASTSGAVRAVLLAVALVPSIVLTVAAVRAYGFERRGALKAIAIYALSLAVGILAVIGDDLMRAPAS